jgi:hypothetical protein
MKRGESLSKLKKIFLSREYFKASAIHLSVGFIFIVSIIYFFIFAKGLLFYHESRSLFIFSDEYFKKFFVKPGGPLEYAGNFLSQFYYLPFTGALIQTILLIAFFLVFIKITGKLLNKSYSLIFALLPFGLLLFLQANYYHSVHYSLGFLILACFFLVFISLSKLGLRYVILVLFPVLYYLIGSFALIFPLLILIYIIFYERGIHRYTMIVFTLLWGVITLMIFKEIIFFQPWGQLLKYPLPYIAFSKLPALYNFLLCYIILLPLLVRFINIQKVDVNPVSFLAAFILIVFFLSKSYNRDLMSFFQIEKAFCRQDYDLVIRLQENSKTKNSNSQYFYNIALAEKGLLCSRMFFGSQDFGTKTLFLQRNQENNSRALYFYYAIGLTGEAHHLAYESMVVNGYRAENLKILVKTELIKGNYKIAGGYMDILKKTLFHRRWVSRYERMLFHPELVSSDPELGEKIRLTPRNDFFISPNDIQNVIKYLSVNPENKKAFEYKLAWLLLKKDVKALIQEIPEMKNMGYSTLPRHIEEAVIEYIYLNREFPSLGGLGINGVTESDYNKYLTVFKRFRGNQGELRQEVKKTCGNSFWYYSRFK